MGTRADFYRGGRDPAAMIWLGSIAWDGYPEGIDDAVLAATTERSYIDAVMAFFEGREDHTHPEMGWPWPWEDSNTTDYAYTFEDGRVWWSNFGRPWHTGPELTEEEFDKADEPSQSLAFPNMKAIQRVDFGKRSGIIIL